MTITAYGIENTFPTYDGLDGLPLQNGRVWLGAAGQNPVISPVSVFWDAAGTQPALQPIPISNGRTVRSDGTPANLYVSGDFSRLVQDSLGRQILFEANQPNTLSAVQAQNWAQQTGSDVQGAAAGSRSAKSWATDDLTPIGANLGGSAKDWAISNALPDGVSKSAKSYSVDSATYAGTAATSVTQAQNARDAALAAARIFADTATGIAGTTAGQYFYVPSADANESLILYLNNAGTATEQKRYPSIAVLNTLLAQYAKVSDFIAPNTEQPLLIDANGNVMVAASGANQALQILVDLIAKKLTVSSLNFPSWVINDLAGFSELGFGVMDASGKVVEVVNRDGTLGQRQPAVRGTAAAKRLPTEINHFLMNGQSLSIRSGLQGPVQDSTDLTFSGGIDLRRTETGNTFVPMVPDGTACILWNAVQQLKFLMAGGNSYSKDALYASDYTLLPSSHGVSGQPISALTKGGSTGAYEDAMFAVDEGVRLAGAAGKSYAVQALSWGQGESDRGRLAADYKADFLAMLASYRTDILAKTGQPNLPKIVTYQPSGNQYDSAAGSEVPNSIADAFFQASEGDPDIIIATPLYWVVHDDTLHFASNSPDGGEALGMKWGEVLYRIVFRGEAWRPVEPVRILTLNSTTVMVYFNVPEPPLVLDTTNVVDPGQYGFDVRDDGGKITINSVAVVNGCAVKLKLARAITTNPKVAYAYYGVGGNGGGPTTGARGNLRDSAKTVGFNGYARLWNWAVAFTKSVPYLKS